MMLLKIVTNAFGSRTLSLSTASYTKGLKPIDMAYTSFESTKSEDGAPPLIIMHGLFGSKANWNSLCKAYHKKLEPTRKIIAVDARNHGDSPHASHHTYQHLAEDLKHMFDSFRIRKAALLGHSMGGRAVMYFALKHPELVEKLIVGDISPVQSSPSLHSMPALLELMANVRMPKSGTLSSARLSVDAQLAKKINDKGLRAFLLTNIVQNGGGHFAWRINLPILMANFSSNIATFPDVSSLRFNGPALFIGGGASDYLQKADHNEIMKIFPSSTFTYIDGAGHWLHSEKPTEFVEITSAFLNDVVVVYN